MDTPQWAERMKRTPSPGFITLRFKKRAGIWAHGIDEKGHACSAAAMVEAPSAFLEACILEA